MTRSANRAIRGPWRRKLFWAWVVVSAIVAAYIGILGPIASYFGEGQAYVAIASTGLMIFFLLTGLGWLILLVTSRRGPSDQSRHSGLHQD